eukprot:656020-Heterocapsa_arctica.AAC.1
MDEQARASWAGQRGRVQPLYRRVGRARPIIHRAPRSRLHRAPHPLPHPSALPRGSIPGTSPPQRARMAHRPSARRNVWIRVAGRR